MGITDIAADYWESEKQRAADNWDQLNNDPVGLAIDQLTFGATGPAPSLDYDPDGSGEGEVPFTIDPGPAPFDEINRGGFDAVDETVDITVETAENAADRVTDITPWYIDYGIPALLVFAALAAVSYSFGQLFDYNIN